MQSQRKKQNFEYRQLCGYRNHPNSNVNGVILEHRLVMSKKLGRALKNGEIVHHIDGNFTNNSPENLQLTTRSDHPSKHKTGITMVPLKCSKCGKEFYREIRQVNTKIKYGQKNFYCSPECGPRFVGNQ